MISSDNELRQEWNRTVDQVLIAGGSLEEVTEFKTIEITAKVSESIRKNGNEPGLFAKILRFAIEVLKEFLDLLMRGGGKEASEKGRNDNDLIHETQHTTKVSEAEYNQVRVEFMRMDSIHQNLNRCNRKVYALQKQKKSLQELLDTSPHNLFKRKERKIMEERIAGLQRQIEMARIQLEAIPKWHGFADVKSVEAAYRASKKALEEMQVKMGDTGRKTIIESKPMTQKQKISILKELAAKRAETQQRDTKKRGKEHGREEMLGAEIG